MYEIKFTCDIFYSYVLFNQAKGLYMSKIKNKIYYFNFLIKTRKCISHVEAKKLLLRGKRAILIEINPLSTGIATKEIPFSTSGNTDMQRGVFLNIYIYYLKLILKIT